MRVGIIFGGPSREREISFAGGRTVYDNLDKSLFTPVPLFVDSHKNFILLDWQYLYKGTIRDFYPVPSYSDPSPRGFQAYVESSPSLNFSLNPEKMDEMISKVGRPIRNLEELKGIMDVAFLALHGEFGEDGQIQGLLEGLDIPYTGSGIKACSIGMDKAFQKKIMDAGGFPTPEIVAFNRRDLKDKWGTEEGYAQVKNTIGFPMVIRPANQGSSIGVSIIYEDEGLDLFLEKTEAAFFEKKISLKDWRSLDENGKHEFITEITDIRSGLGFPMDAYCPEGVKTYLPHPEHLYDYLDESKDETIRLAAYNAETTVIVEEFIRGKEFSCIVVRQENGSSIALPPTEIVKGGEVFDYRSKYLPGLSRKVTPINLPENDIEKIRQECVKLFEFLEFDVYARIDGFINPEGTIFLNDPNTTSGMLPSSFFFHQAAEIGLNPSRFLTFLIRMSLQERIKNATQRKDYEEKLDELDHRLEQMKSQGSDKKPIGVIMGGYSFERHISVESGRNIFEKLASSNKYEPIPLFLIGDEHHFDLYQIPINIMLKDNADDIRDKILHYESHPVLEKIRKECASITNKYAPSGAVFKPRKISMTELAEMVEGTFIALHGRPGEDGTIQKELEKVGIPYNGSGPGSSGITINKYQTLQTLKKHGFSVAEQYLGYKEEFLANKQAELAKIEERFGYPLIAKPVDDGCSSAVKVIKSTEQMQAFLETLYREEEDLPEKQRQILGLKFKEEFPRKNQVLIEELIRSNGAKHFLEITGGMLTHHGESGERVYEVFEPSEALTTGEVLSLEEKFLAGEGQNITPARFAKSGINYETIAKQVKETLQKAAEILDVKGYCRIDAFVRIFEDGTAETLIIEINSLPGMTPATCIFHQCAINGYEPYGFIDKILEFGFHERDKQPTA